MSNFPAELSIPRPISSKRTPRDPSNRKSVSFNDTPIVHEVPSNDRTRTTSSSETCRSWTFTDVPQRSSTRVPDWSSKMKISSIIDSHSDDPIQKLVPSISPLSISSSVASDERHSSRRSSLFSEFDPSRSVPFVCHGPVSESTATYTNILSTSLTSPPTEPIIHSRSSRIRSANLPLTNNTLRPMESISITPLRSSRFPSRSNGTTKSSRYLSPTHQRNPTAISPRSRSAHVSSAPSAPISTSQQRKRSPNVRQSYGSYYMHRLLLPAPIH